MGDNNSYCIGNGQIEGSAYFKIRDNYDYGTYYGGWRGDSSNSVELSGTYNISSECKGSNLNDCKEFVINMKKGKTYKVSFDGNTVTLTVSDTKYYLTGDIDRWQSSKSFQGKDGSNTLVKTISNWKSNNGENTDVPQFKINTSFGVWYGYSSTTAFNNNTSRSISSDGNNDVLNTSANGKNVTFTLQLDENGTPSSLTASWDEPNGLKVVPLRVEDRNSSEEWGKVSSSKPVVYLLGNTINGNRPSPEWEMETTDYNVYTLEFTARNSNMTTWSGDDDDWMDYPYKVRVFTSQNDKGTDYGSVATTGDPWSKMTYNNSQKGNLTPGCRYVATYTHSSKSLSIVPKGGEYTSGANYPPFISLVGYHFKQNTQYNTPTEGKKNTNGWQEAWIQYDAEGNVATDIEGNVMYNTQWPPKNPVYFYVTKSGSNDVIELTSDNLQLIAETDNGKKKVQTGAEWKAQLVTNNTENADEYQNLFSSSFNEGVGKRQYLNNDRSYIRYVAENVWIFGSTKVWTGWGGTYTDNGQDQANWSNYSNWGIGAEYDNEKGSTISANEPWNLKAEAGNFSFTKPTFFKTVEIFYCTNKLSATNEFGGMHDGCVFYTTEGFGTPSINAKSMNEYTVADYEVAVSNVPSGYTITGYTITRYDATTDKPCNKQRMETTVTNAKVKSESGKNYTEAQFNNLYKFVSSYTNAKEPDLADGKYYYELTVEFSNGSTTKKESVTSPVVTILNPNVLTPITALQLCEVVSTTDSKISAYKYITYDPEDGLVYGVTNTGDVINTTVLSGDFSSYYGNKSLVKFTDYVLLMASAPSRFSNNSTVYPLKGIGAYSLKGELLSTSSSGNSYGTLAGTKIAGGKQTNNSYKEIRKLSNFNTAKYNLELGFTYYPEGSTGQAVTRTSEPEEGETYLTIPSPVFVDGKVEVIKGSIDDTKDGNDAKKDFTFRSKAYGDDFPFTLKDARYQSLRESIEVDIVNANDNLAGMYKGQGYFNYYINGNQVYIDKEGNSFDVSTKLPKDIMEGNQTVTMQPNPDKPANIYNVWENGTIDGINITKAAPQPITGTVNSKQYNSEVKLTSRALYYDYESVAGTEDANNPDLIETFNLHVMIDATNDNTVTTTDSNGTVTDQLLHHDENKDIYDYYYVTVVEKNTATERDDWKIIATDESSDVHETVYAEYVVTLEDLNSNTYGGDRNTHSAGIDIPITFNHGKYYEGQIDKVTNNPYFGNLEVRVSYLYPFSTYQPSDSQKAGMRKVSSDMSTEGDDQVLKSEAYVSEVNGEVATSVDGLTLRPEVTVIAGIGFITVEGNDVEIFNAQGMKVAAGEGRHDLNAGVYVVRVSGQTHKVMVR